MWTITVKDFTSWADLYMKIPWCYTLTADNHNRLKQIQCSMSMQKHVEVDCHFIQEKVGNKGIVDIYAPA